MLRRLVNRFTICRRIGHPVSGVKGRSPWNCLNCGKDVRDKRWRDD